MADTILIPSAVPADTNNDEKNYLVKENYLSEFESEDEKSVARANLGVYAKEAVYTQDEAELMANEKIHAALQNYVTADELPAAIADLSNEIANAGYVKSDGSVPFTSAQTQSAMPVDDYHLVNKIYADNLIKAHINSNDPHNILDKVNTLLAGYAKLSDTYRAAYLYTRRETDDILKSYVKRDGSTGFTNPQMGIDPALPSHLATARYVKLVMQNHESSADAHGFLKILKNTLSNYYNKSETYTKAQTYSREQLIAIVRNQMNDVVKSALATYEAENGSISELKEWAEGELFKCIKADGSVVHTNPQAGVAAVNPNEFIILEQLNKALDDLKQDINTDVTEKTNQTTWVTTGPVMTTVGFVEDNTQLPKEMTVQQIMDAIFYGKTLGITAPPYAEYGDTVCIKIFIHGLNNVTSVDIYKNDVLIGTLTADDLKNLKESTDDSGHYYEYCDTGKFTEDVEWKAVFHFDGASDVIEKATTKLSYSMFIGAIPYWWNAQEDVTMESLNKLCEEDPVNIKKISDEGPEITTVSNTFDFTDTRLKSLIAVVPYDYPDLKSIITPAQEVSVDAFTKWVQPMYPNNTTIGIPYKIYVFGQPLVKLQQDIKFNFGKEEQP